MKNEQLSTYTLFINPSEIILTPDCAFTQLLWQLQMGGA